MSPQARPRRIVGWAIVAMALGLPAGAAEAAERATVAAEIDGRPVAAGTESRPIRLRPDRPAAVSLRVTNSDQAGFDVRIVRVEGRVMGLAFFAYETATSLTVAPGATDTLAFSLDLGDLDGQATGLVLGAVTLLDGEREELAREATVFDVRGSVWSVYGVFGLAVAGLTVVSFTVALVHLARHTLPPNRFRRALRFLTPGIGLGLTLVFTLSALRVFVPRTGRWVPIILISSLALFVLGYFTPSPEDDEDEEELAEATAANRER